MRAQTEYLQAITEYLCTTSEYLKSKNRYLRVITLDLRVLGLAAACVRDVTGGCPSSQPKGPQRSGA